VAALVVGARAAVGAALVAPGTPADHTGTAGDPASLSILMRYLAPNHYPLSFVVGWSWWRRQHQAHAQACHYRRRTAKRE
jgi:hypothetical protein